ncbi:class I SAM-dependent methyltransferase [Synechococcus sp. HB1133]|uniref:class I SAM-dependent methyltransferase n=1 Tax=unclassified Synechococcus TaxID=2626047 RepID=UPI0014077BCE|nr:MULTISPECIES: class I SAM-dependent methyltransferase [unclassified Synechococcus]MCB4421468.1 class I SAM-dependent methyltransferase [Synechococcus sp. HB1133]MCB4431181.1 class I SAM-dependent methyltransferase [Synechococcus sp. HBA1120]NHI80410.1 class I SAM-dependent methyltransferase [Synechococcus sp. HB1133]
MLSKKIDSCRICKNQGIDLILDLGEQPLANSLKREAYIGENKVPLIICRCTKCGTIQLTENASPEVMFEDYVWVTGTSSTAKEYSKVFCQRVIDKAKGDGLRIVEIASNDGTFLESFKGKGHKVLGVDPAKNIAEIANERKIPTIDKFFSEELAETIVTDYGAADIVIARNVIPHVPDPNNIVSGIAKTLKNEGIGVIEFHWSEKIVKEIHYDSIYHEHYFYHSIASLERLLKIHGLKVFDVDISPISGGSLVIYFSKEQRKESKELNELRSHENSIGLNSKEQWDEFAKASKLHSKLLRNMVIEEYEKGKKIIGYGASARSSTMLNFCNIDNSLITLIADKSSLKHGKYTAGTNILITDPDTALECKPDIILLLAWNFKDEIIQELKERGYKGEVIVPLPVKPTKITI